MQSLASRELIAGVELVSPRSLPVPQRFFGSRALINIGHVWVLHRRRVVQVLAAILAVGAIGSVLAARQSIADGAAALAGMIQGEFADAGFAITAIEISGQTLSHEQDIVALLGVGPDSSTLTFDVDEARRRLAWLRAVQSATIRKVYPGQLLVSIVERQPVARWRSGGITYLIDAEGRQIGEDGGAFTELPLVMGEGASDDALGMIRALSRFEDLQREVIALSRIGDRRWDMVFRSGLKVQLPEFGVAQALQRLDLYRRDYAVLDRDVTVIDLRVPGVVALTPAIREAEDTGDKR